MAPHPVVHFLQAPGWPRKANAPCVQVEVMWARSHSAIAKSHPKVTQALLEHLGEPPRPLFKVVLQESKVWDIGWILPFAEMGRTSISRGELEVKVQLVVGHPLNRVRSRAAKDPPQPTQQSAHNRHAIPSGGRSRYVCERWQRLPVLSGALELSRWCLPWSGQRHPGLWGQRG